MKLDIRPRNKQFTRPIDDAISCGFGNVHKLLQDRRKDEKIILITSDSNKIMTEEFKSIVQDSGFNSVTIQVI